MDSLKVQCDRKGSERQRERYRERDIERQRGRQKERVRERDIQRGEDVQQTAKAGFQLMPLRYGLRLHTLIR